MYSIFSLKKEKEFLFCGDINVCKSCTLAKSNEMSSSWSEPYYNSSVVCPHTKSVIFGPISTRLSGIVKVIPEKVLNYI